MSDRDKQPGNSDSTGFAGFIRDHLTDILDDWERKVRSRPSAQELPRPVLLNHMPELLSFIADYAQRIEAGNMADISDDASEIHAVNRLEVGFDLGQVINEFTLLRSCILGRWKRHRPAQLPWDGLWALDHAVDKAIVASVERYTHVQHSTLAALDRVSAAALESKRLDDFLQRLLQAVRATMPTVDTAAVLLLEGDTLWVRATVGLHEEVSSAFGLAVGAGITGRIAAGRQPILFTAAQIDAYASSDVLRRRHLQALYGVPLLTGRQLVGVLHVGSQSAPDFSEQDKLLLSSMAQRAAAAIVQHRLRDAAEVHARQQSAIAELGRLGLLTDDVQRVMDRAAALIVDVLGVDTAAIERLEPDQRLCVAAQDGDRLFGSSRSVTPGSQAEHTLAAIQPVLVQDYRAEQRCSYSPPLREQGILSAITAPIRLRSEQSDLPYGLIGAYSRQRRTFSDQDGLFLQAIGSIISSALMLRKWSTALRESEERLRLAMEVAQLGTFDWDLTTSDIRWSAKTRKMFGVSDDYPINWENRAMLIHPDDREHSLRLIDEALAPGSNGAYAAEYRVLPADGSAERWISTQGKALVDWQGQPLRFIGLVKDITARKHADLEQQRLMRELEQAVRFREDTLAIVSHDLRSPLAAISLSASLLSRRLPADSDNRLHQKLATILRASGHMEHLIDDLLDMANIQTGRLSIEPGSCDAAALVNEAADFHASAAAAKSVALDRRIAINDVEIRCDHERIQQVFSNLLSNAIKFSEQGMTVVLRVEQDDDCVRFTIADSGPGIAPEALAHIFEPYWSAGGHARQGTGLGLFIAKGIVEAHGGRLWVDSSPNEGAAFHFSLPLGRR